jgi:hypothetical protein
MDTPPNPDLDFDFDYLVENPDNEILYHMKDALGNSYAVPCGRVEYALGRRFTFYSDEESELYTRENKDAPSVKERRLVLLRAVKKSLEYEQRLRNQKAAEYGWPIHPNDVEDLTPEQKSVMLEAWCSHLPPPEFLLNEPPPQVEEVAMAELETSEVLRKTLEILKTQAVYIRNLHDAFSALHDTVMRIDPRAKQFDQEEMLKIRPNDVQRAAVEEIDQLLRELNELR